MNAITQDESPARTFHPNWMILLLLVSLAVVVLVALASRKPSVSSSDTSAQQILATIPTLRADSETSRAMALVLQELHAAPDKSKAWIALGDILAQEQRGSGSAAYYTRAEAAYRQALKLAPRSADAMTGMSWVYGGRHQYLESVEWAHRALEVDEQNPTAHGLLSDAALELGDYEKACDHCQMMMDLRPDLSAWSRGAHLLWVMGDRVRAIPLMEKAIRSGAPFAENTAWCRARLATMLLHSGALQPAAQALEPALKSAPENAHVLLAAGRIATARGDLEGAALHFNKMLERGASHDALVALGDLCAAKGDKAAAEQYYSKVEALHATNTAAGAHDHTSMAKFYADHDRNVTAALKLAEQHRDTRNVWEADVLAWVRLKNGDAPGAATAMKLALSQNTPDPEMHFHAGMIAAEVGDSASAQKHLRTALSLNPSFHPLLADVARETLGRFAMGLGSADMKTKGKRSL